MELYLNGRSVSIYHFPSVIDLFFENYIGSTGHRYSWCQRRRYSEDADGEIRTCNPSVRERSLSMAHIGGEEILSEELKIP